jgi:hypothetical protein
MARESYVVLFCVPEPTIDRVRNAVKKLPVAKINHGAFLVGLRFPSDYPGTINRLKVGLPDLCLTACYMQTGYKPFVAPRDTTDEPGVEKIIEGDW